MADGTSAYEGLEIEEDYRQQRLEWRIERAWWAVLFALIALAALGLFGSGLLSTQHSSDGPLEVRWDRFVRNDAPTIVRITAPVESNEATLAVSADFLDDVTVEEVQPEPDSIEVGDAAVSYTFQAAEGATSMRVTFRLLPQRVGRLRGSVQAGDNRVSFTQFSYP